MSIIIGIDHGYYAIKTAHCSFPAGVTSYGEHEPYTRQGLLELAGCFFVCGTGRQPIQRDKTVNDNYYLLTLAAIAKEIQQRSLPPECSVRIAAGLPLTSFGRDKPKFRDYLFRTSQPVHYRFEGVEYSVTIEEVAIFPQGYAALMTETGLLQDEPSMLLMDLGGWTVDLMRIDNAIPVADTAHSLELGMIRCVDDIREQVRRETGLSLTDHRYCAYEVDKFYLVSTTDKDAVLDVAKKEQIDADERQTEPASGTDRGSSGEPDGNSAGQPEREVSGTEQGAGPTGMGNAPEQPDGDGRGDRLEGIGVQLTEPTTEQDLSEAEEEIASAFSLPDLPTVEQQIRAIEAPIQARYADEIVLDPEVVDEILRAGSNQNKGHLRLIYNFMVEKTSEEYRLFCENKSRNCCITRSFWRMALPNVPKNPAQSRITI